MRLKSIQIVGFATVSIATVFSWGSAIACEQNDRNCATPGGAGSTPRVVELRNTNGGITTLTSIPSGSALVTSFSAPTCQYDAYDETTVITPVEPAPDADPDDPLPPTLISVEQTPTTRDGGSYLYTEHEVTAGIGNQDLVDTVTSRIANGNLSDYDHGLAVGVTLEFTPLEEATRRFRIGCVPPTDDLLVNTRIDRSRFPTFVDIGPFDPIFDLRSQITNLYNRLQLIKPTVIDERVVDIWGGVIVRSPVWLSINANAWQVQTSHAIDHLGWELQLLAIPSTLDFTIAFESSDQDTDHLSFIAVADCLGANTTEPLNIAGSQVPARPSDLAEWSQPGITGPCQWTPPARGEATITANITYDITLLVSGHALPLPDYEWQSDPTTYDVGELHAVNINNIGRS